MYLRTHVSTLTGTCALGDTSAQMRTVGGGVPTARVAHSITLHKQKGWVGKSLLKNGNVPDL